MWDSFSPIRQLNANFPTCYGLERSLSYPSKKIPCSHNNKISFHSSWSRFENNRIDIHSFTNRNANTIFKEASKLCTKSVKHIRSFPTTNIQHGFHVENIFWKSIPCKLVFFSCLVQVLGLVDQTQSIFFCLLKILPIWRDQVFQCVWIIEDRWEFIKLYGINIPSDNDTIGMESFAYVVVGIVHCEYLLRK